MRELLRLGVTIYFEKENIDTGKMTSEQAADIYGAFAQMETTGHSQNMRISNRIRMEKGMFVPSSAPYGYRLVNNELVIVPEEAEVVRKIYKMYLSGCGCPEIAKELNHLCVPRENQTGTWYQYGVSYILRNVTYTGDQLWQKTFATDVLPFKQIKNRGQKPQCDSILRPMLTQLGELRERELRTNNRICDIDREMAHLAEQNLVLNRLKDKGYVDPALYLSQQDEINSKALELRRLRRSIMERTRGDETIRKTEVMLDYLEDCPEWPEEIEPELFEMLIDRLALTSDRQVKIRLINGLEVTEPIERTVA